MSDAWSSFELEQFERVDAAPDTVLLRVIARPVAGTSGNDPPTLVIDDGEQRHRHTALAVPPDRSGLLRAAYSARASVLRRAAGFALELSDGALVELPAPTARERAAVLPDPAARIAELQRELDAERELRTQAEARLEQAGRAQTQTAVALSELELEQLAARAIQSELHSQLRRTTEALAALESQAELAGSRERLAALIAERDDLRQELAQCFDKLASLTAERDEAN